MHARNLYPKLDQWVGAWLRRPGSRTTSARVGPGRRLLEFASSATFYLGLMGGLLYLSHRMLEAGVWAGWVIGGPFVFAALVIHAAERVVPYRRRWNRDHGDSVADGYHVVITGGIVSELYRFSFGLLVPPVAALLLEWRGSSIWPTEAPVVVRFAIAAVIAEFGYYWAHRLGHRTRLWRAHAVHHSPQRLYGLNFLREHPIALLPIYIGLFVPLMAVGCDVHTLTLIVIFTMLHGLFQHCNLDLRLGPLNWIFSSPIVHRWHHSSEREEAQTNYGANLLLWDIVFGTRFLPRNVDVPQIGIEELEGFPATFLGQMKVPFHFERLQRPAAPSSRDSVSPKSTKRRPKVADSFPRPSSEHGEMVAALAPSNGTQLAKSGEGDQERSRFGISSRPGILTRLER